MNVEIPVSVPLMFNLVVYATLDICTYVIYAIYNFY